MQCSLRSASSALMPALLCVHGAGVAPASLWVPQIEVQGGGQCKCIVAHKNQLWIGKATAVGLPVWLTDVCGPLCRY